MCCLFHCLNFFSHLQVWTCLHRDACWEWAIAPRVSPPPRYQHAAAPCIWTLEGHLVVIAWWKIHQVLQCWILQQEFAVRPNLSVPVQGLAGTVLMLLVGIPQLS